MTKALFVLSLDTEIAWAEAGQLPNPLYRDRFDNYQTIVTRLIDLLDTYQIPATWAIVGALLLNHMDELDVAEPIYQWSDPQTTASALFYECAYDNPNWYHCHDILQQIQNADVSHEIGTHTFTHVYATDPATTSSIFSNQLSAVEKEFNKYGISLESIVFPRNQINYLDLLSQFNIIAYRGIEMNWYRTLPGLIKRIAHYLDRLLAITPPTYDIESLIARPNLVNVPSSQFLLHYDGIRDYIPTHSRVLQAKRGIDMAIRKKHLYHLWFHPHNLGSSDKMFIALEEILAYVVTLVRDDKIRVATMGQVARQLLGED